MKYNYQTTYEDESPDGTTRITAEILITYTVIWGCPARIHHDENDHPAEADELEIEKIEIEQPSIAFFEEASWRKPTEEEHQILLAWSIGLCEDMLSEAREEEAEAKAEAKADAEFEAETRADLDEWPIG